MMRQNQKNTFYYFLVSLLFYLSMLHIVLPAFSSDDLQLMKGKQKTDRSIKLNIVVDATVETVFNLWTTVEGCRKFFGKDAIIDLKPGGKYEIYFLPRIDPKSDINSTKGAKLLWMKKNKKLAFEWAMPPFAREYNVNPLPTWVEVSFRPLKINSSKTCVHLEHHGFKRGGKWDHVYEFFIKGWSDILFRLDLLCAEFH